MKRAQLRRMIYDNLKPEMPGLVVCDEMICATPVNSILRGVILSPLVRSPLSLRVCAFARPLFSPDAGFMGATSPIAWGLLRMDTWNFNKLEDPRRFQRLIRNTRRKMRRLSLVDTPKRFAKNYVWVFGTRVTGWDWLRIAFCYAHAGYYEKASKILRRKVLTWRPHHQVHILLADYCSPLLEAMEAKDQERVRDLIVKREEITIGEFRGRGANLNMLF